MWFKLASHLHKSYQEIRRETTSSEFVMWMEYLRRDANAFNPKHYYLAQIAMWIKRSMVKKPDKVSLDEFLIKFKMENPEKKKIEQEQQTEQTKSWWKQFVGLKG